MRRVPRDARCRPGQLRARAARRLPRDRRRRARLDDRDLRRAAARDRQLALVGRAVLHPHGQAACRSRRPSCGSSSGARRGSASIAHRTRSPEPDQLVVKLDPTTGRPAAGGGAARRHREPEQINLDMEFARGGRRGPGALRGAAARGDEGRQHALHPAGQRRGGLAGHAAAARQPSARARVRQGIVGPGGGEQAGRRLRRAGTSPWVAS